MHKLTIYRPTEIVKVCFTKHREEEKIANLRIQARRRKTVFPVDSSIDSCAILGYDEYTTLGRYRPMEDMIREDLRGGRAL